MSTVFFIVTMIIYATANTVQRGTIGTKTKTLNEMDTMQLNEISNRVRRNTSEPSNVFEIPEIDENTRRHLMEDVLSHVPLSQIPSKDIITYLISGRIKRSYNDYDSSEDHENINPKKQLEEISSRNFVSEAYNEEQRKKLFFSQLFSMIDGSRTSGQSIDLENDDPLNLNKSFEPYIEERFSERSPILRTDKHGKSNDIDLEKNIYVPVRKTKKRRQAQNRRSFSNNLKGEKKVNGRSERQLGEYDDNAETQFYRINKYTPRSSEDYESIEKSTDQLLTSGPTGIDVIEKSSVYVLPTTISNDHDYVEEFDNNLNLTNLSSSIVDLESNVTPDNINESEQDEWISTKGIFNTFKDSKGPDENVAFLKNKVAEPSSITNSTYISNEGKSIEDIVENEYESINTEISIVDSEFKIINSSIEETNDKYHSPYINAALNKQNDFDKIQSRRTNDNFENKNVEPIKIENVLKIERDETEETQDVKVASVIGEAEVSSNQSNVLLNPLTARIKLDFLIQLQAQGNDK